MKKIILLCISAMLTVMAVAQNPKADIEAKYKKEKGFASYTVDANMLKMIQMAPGVDDETKKILEQTTEQTIMAIDNAALVTAFVKDAIAAYDKVNYTETIDINQPEQGVTGKAYAKVEGDFITEIVVVFGLKKQAGVQILKGKYDKEMLKTAAESLMSGK